MLKCFFFQIITMIELFISKIQSHFNWDNWTLMETNKTRDECSYVKISEW